MKIVQTICVLLIMNISFAQNFESFEALSLKKLEARFSYTLKHYTKTRLANSNEDEFLQVHKMTFNNGEITIYHMYSNNPAAISLGRSVDPLGEITTARLSSTYTFHINDVKIKDDGRLSIDILKDGTGDTSLFISLNKAMELSYHKTGGYKKGDYNNRFNVISPTNSSQKYFVESIEQTSIQPWETSFIIIPLNSDIMDNGVSGPELLALFEAYRKKYN